MRIKIVYLVSLDKIWHSTQWVLTATSSSLEDG